MSDCKHCGKPISTAAELGYWFHTNTSPMLDACQIPPVTYATPKEAS
ncbi:hypothetical protein MWT96_20380 [Prescottella equi]|nr:hypothetical protein [Prescottella equi]NKT97293.1 hypothetical protein [Prescottella equi]UPH36722.1 hypothetical protein GS533_001320 [Prescottella equi]UPH40827.1 hypothetical protein MWT96_20380 [Prescottella equi]